MAFTEDWYQQHQAKMAAQRVAGGAVRVLDRPVDATKTVGGTGDDCSAVSRGVRPPDCGDGDRLTERRVETSVTAGETAQNPEPLCVMTPAGRNRQAERAAELPMAGHRRGNATSYPNAAAAARRGVTGGERPAPKSKRRTPEQDFQKDCVKFLNAALLPYWRVVHVPNGGTTGGHKAKIVGGIRKAMGVREGFPDLMLVGPGRCVAIELKAAGRRGKVLSEAQEEWRDWFKHVGLPWFLARSIDDVIAACQDAGVPLRVRV